MTEAALQVCCGSCGSKINVPESLLVQLLYVRQFNCPKCKQPQALNVDPQYVARLLGGAQRPPVDSQVTSTSDASAHPAQGGASRYAAGLNERVVQSPVHSWQGNLDANTQLAVRFARSQDHRRRLPPGHVLSGRSPDIQIIQRQQAAEAEPEEEGDEGGERGDTFSEYRPAKLTMGIRHPDAVVETASLAAVEPPDVTYVLHIMDTVEQDLLSGLQLESIIYACQRHEQFHPDNFRCGFFIGDGAGVGKGRTIAGLMLENWRCGRKRHLWISIGSDLKVDARRDLDDVGATDMLVHALNKQPYAALDSDKVGIREGVMFLTYASLASSSEAGHTRIDQLVEWCGEGFDGLIVFDESHKAKNLVPDSGAKPSKVGAKVLELQTRLPQARIVYCSATGASEPRQMGYMVRLGLWGAANPSFPAFADFMAAMGSRGMAALELVAMDMKAQGMYVCRTLSFAGADFEMVRAELEPDMQRMYCEAAHMWGALRREFLFALEQMGGADRGTRKQGSPLWRFFWAAHQRFFRHMCMASKVPCLVRMSQQALEDGKCIVIGLQSTGEARTADVIAERGEELDEFVSGPKELMLKLVEDHYPLPGDASEPNRGSKRAAENGQKPPGKRRRGAAKAAEARDTPEPAAESSLLQLASSEEKIKAEDSSNVSNGIHPSPQPSPQHPSMAPEDPAQQPDAKRSMKVVIRRLPHSLQRLQQQNGRLGEPAIESPAGQPVIRTKQEKREDLERAREQDRIKQQQASGEKLKELLHRKEQTKNAILALSLPSNPLDQLIDQLGGPDAVAEMTGRKGRLVRQKDSERVKWEARNASGVAAGAIMDMINVHERELFLAGTKLVAIISEAASAGISLHADRRAKNQRRRVHLTLELPWSADKCLQQFGRSHRANQAHGPQYRLLFTPLGGERRFASAVARRLEIMGALTQGDRRAGPSFSDFNYESTWGQKALKATYAAIMQEDHAQTLPPACKPSGPEQQPKYSATRFYARARSLLLDVGIIRPGTEVSAADITGYINSNSAPTNVGKITDPDRSDVPRFLNRLLGLDPEGQADLFDFFQALLENIILAARKDGKYDDGITSITGSAVTLAADPQVIRKDASTAAPTLLYRVSVDRGVPWEQALALLMGHAASPAPQDEVQLGAETLPSGQEAQLAEQPDACKLEEALAQSPVEDEGSEPEVVVLDGRGPGAVAAKPIPPMGDTGASGFYRLKHDPGGKRSSVLLALKLAAVRPGAGADPAAAAGQPSLRFHFVRPCTGRLPRAVDQSELLHKYERISPEAGRLLWQEAWRTSDKDHHGPNASLRWREVRLIGGLVLPVWDTVERALRHQTRAVDRRLHVVRIMLTGEESRRLVGMQIPAAAVDEIVAGLRSSPGGVPYSAPPPVIELDD